jgi:hypothetical protein
MPQFSTHLTWPFIKTPNLRLFQITKIYISENPKTKLQFISSYFDITKNSHNNINIKFTTKVYASPYY